MRISYMGKDGKLERVAIIEVSKKSEEKKLELIITELDKMGYRASGFEGENGDYYMIPVDDREDYNGLKAEYLELKRA